MIKSLKRPLPLLVAALCASGTAQAIDFDAGGWDGSFNTTVSFGQSWRDEARDPRLIGTADGGTGRSVNIDDGDLNYRTGARLERLQGRVRILTRSRELRALCPRFAPL